MGRSINDLENEFDENIYDDAEFYQVFLLVYILGTIKRLHDRI
jgi:hypothetical protein